VSHSDNSMERWDTSQAVEARVAELLGRLTLEEKVDLVSGKNDVASRPDWSKEPLPPYPVLSLADGPAGVRMNAPVINGGRATALPAPIALAASWDPELARQYGDLLGAEFAATGHNVMLGPAVDIARAPVGGRTFEAFGEDPLLQACMAAAEIAAIQAHGVQACLKHYLANNQEYQRNTIDVQVDERTLQEIYLPPVAAAVRAGVASVMGSYNKVNGTYACENPHLLTTILREQLGFQGWVMSDFLATPSTVAAANAGLEWELGPRHWGEHLLEAVRSGAVPAERLDEMVRRILRPTLGLGLDQRPPTVGAVPAERHGEIARAIAEQCIVLLKNDGDLLPLSRDGLGSIAVIGPDAASVAAAGGGSAGVQPTYGVSVLAGLRRYLGESVRISHVPGVDPIGAGALLPGLPAIPSGWLIPEGGAADERGLRASYWANTEFAGEPHATQVEPGVNINYGFFDLFAGANPATPGAPAKPAGLDGGFSARWSGQLAIPTDGDYTLQLSCHGVARLSLDGALVIDTAASAGENAGVTTLHAATIRLRAGSTPKVIVEYIAPPRPHGFGFPEARLRLGWKPPAGVLDPKIHEAAEIARGSEIALVVARTYEGEQMDRPDLALPNGQGELIQAVAAANPRTVVVLMSGGPAETTSWEGSVPAIVEAWYAGQEQGTAVARVLFGEVNPAGRLPLTFPRSMSATPIAAPEQYPGVGGIVRYSEGLRVGYRGYDQPGLTPQYPFGYGLSYTTFAYANLRLSAEVLGADEALTVSVDVTNTGERAGDEVVQLYVKHLSSAVERPGLELKGFRRISLDPGETKTVGLALAARDLAYWNAGEGRFAVEHDTIQIQVGRSSADIQLKATAQVGAG
jgi:beta-glucosidase